MTPKVTDPSERTPDLARTSPNEPVDWLDEVIAYIRVPEHTFLEAKEYMQSKLDSQKAGAYERGYQHGHKIGYEEGISGYQPDTQSSQDREPTKGG